MITVMSLVASLFAALIVHYNLLDMLGLQLVTPLFCGSI